MAGARPGLVIFDCDGVIVDSEKISARVVAGNLARYGWALDVEEADRLFTGGTMTGTRDIALARGLRLPEDWVDQVYAEMFVELAETPPIAGVGAVLDALDREGLPYCIGSNGPHAKMDVTLGAVGFRARFEGRRFSAREVAAPKPAPDLFLYAAERMGVAPARAVVVGDTINDAKAAHAAGMPCFGYAAATPAASLGEHGATPFAAMDALPGLLGL